MSALWGAQTPVFLVTGREAKWPPGESRKVAPSTLNQRMSLSAALRLLWAWATLEASKCHQSRSQVGQAWDRSPERPVPAATTARGRLLVC